MRDHDIKSLYSAEEKYDLLSVFMASRSALWSFFALSFFTNLLSLGAIVFAVSIASGRAVLSFAGVAACFSVIGLAYAFRQVRSRWVNRTLLALDVKISGRAIDMLGDSGAQDAMSENFSRDLDSMRAMLSGEVLSSILDAPFALLFLAATGVMFGPFFFVALFLALFYIAFAVYAAMRISELEVRATGAFSERDTLARKLVRDAADIRNLAMSDKVRSMLRDFHNAAAVVANRRSREMDRFLSMNFAVLFGGLVLLAALSRAVGLSAAEILGVLLLFAHANALVGGFLKFLPEYFSFVSGAERIAGLIEDSSASARGGTIDSLTTGTLRLAGLSLDDGRGGALLDGADFTFDDGRIYIVKAGSAFEGSRVLRALSGGVLPAFGQVFFDEYDLARVSRDSLKDFVRFSPRRYFILDGTIRENIEGLLSPDAHDAGFKSFIGYKKAAEMLGFAKEVENLEAGYGTMVSRGTRVVSEEMLKRISLARTLCGNPRVMIFDNPLYGLSSHGRESFLRAIESLKGKRISIIANSESLPIAKTTLTVSDGKITAAEEGAAIEGDESSGASRALFKRVFRK